LTGSVTSVNFSLLLDLYGVWTFISPELLVFVVLISALYLYATRAREDRPSPVSGRRKALFIAGMGLFYVGWGGPLNVLGHFLFGAHMLKMSILYLAMPPMILLGIPADWFRTLLKPRAIKMVVAFFTHPLLALILFNGLFSLYHLPLVFDRIMSDYWLHAGVHLLLEIAAFFMWWPVVAPVPEMDRLHGLLKMGYILANGILITPACAMIIFADTPLYKLYTEGAAMLCLPFSYITFDSPQTFNLLPISIRDDQQTGGVIMKLAQEFIYGCFLAYCFFDWYKKERKKEEELDIELEKMVTDSN